MADDIGDIFRNARDYRREQGWDKDEEVREYEIRPGDEKRVMLLFHELEALGDELRATDSPHADRLDRIVERFHAGITRVR